MGYVTVWADPTFISKLTRSRNWKLTHVVRTCVSILAISVIVTWSKNTRMLKHWQADSSIWYILIFATTVTYFLLFLLTSLVDVNTGSSITTMLNPDTFPFVTGWLVGLLICGWLLWHLRPETSQRFYSWINHLTLIIGKLVELASPAPDDWEAADQ